MGPESDQTEWSADDTLGAKLAADLSWRQICKRAVEKGEKAHSITRNRVHFPHRQAVLCHRRLLLSVRSFCERKGFVRNRGKADGGRTLGARDSVRCILLEHSWTMYGGSASVVRDTRSEERNLFGQQQAAARAEAATATLPSPPSLPTACFSADTASDAASMLQPNAEVCVVPSPPHSPLPTPHAPCRNAHPSATPIARSAQPPRTRER